MAEEKLEQEPKHKKKKRRKKHYFLRLLIFIALIAAGIFALRSELFNVTEFDVSGNSYFTAAQIRELSGLTTGVNMFDQKLGPAKEALLDNPYIKTAQIKRVPPHTVQIVIEERPEYACLPYGSQFVIIDNEGMVLRLADEQPVLPLLDGDDLVINSMSLGNAIDVEPSYLLTHTLELLSVMEKNDLYFKRIVFSKVVVKAYIYDDLYCEGKPEDITNQMGAVKRLVEEQYSQGITRGVIKVGKDNYIAFSPKLE